MFAPKQSRWPPISDITDSSSFNGKIFRKKSMSENFPANVLNTRKRLKCQKVCQFIQCIITFTHQEPLIQLQLVVWSMFAWPALITFTITSRRPQSPPQWLFAWSINSFQRRHCCIPLCMGRKSMRLSTRAGLLQLKVSYERKSY